ncbi:hypothetical protein GGS23DRAFT_616498 [Durotheca rogersii]|uniref:uncharacterized protein n=1 Tax=Durotheca rogersii TaxID=419775 RepID=UPI00221F6FDA|nr:uncharacterized protein GGS23DRAFT_616498 [Durotheca rogersii]KAI5858174.1 hypothetical protein GGS23DRAFT_616498 [Durotheca rogersii]
MGDGLGLTSPELPDRALEGHLQPPKMAAPNLGHPQDFAALGQIGIGFSLPASQHHSDSYNPLEDSVARWYQRNDGPWTPHCLASSRDDIGNPAVLNNLRASSITYYNQPRGNLVPSECDPISPRGVPSDSGYGSYRAKHSVANGSVCDESFDRNTETQSSIENLGDPTFHPYNLPKGGLGTGDSWPQSQLPPPPGSSAEHQANLGKDIAPCLLCNKSMKTMSEFKKHHQRHIKPFKCDVKNCPRDGGFSTRNDLDRHKRSLHPDELATGNRYRCLLGLCKDKKKIWPRADNFRAHMKRIHHIAPITDDELDEYKFRPEPQANGTLGRTRDGVASDFSGSMFPAERAGRAAEGWGLPRNPRVGLSAEPSPLEGGLGQNQAEETPLLHRPLALHYSHVLGIDKRDNNDGDTASAGVTDSRDDDKALDNPKETHQMALTTPRHAIDEARSGKLGQIVESDEHHQSERPESESDLGNHESILEFLERLQSQGLLEKFGYKKEDRPRPENTTRELANGTGSKQAYHCMLCKKKFNRRCELKKHEKRHQRPYGCTYPDCTKRFGSKNDWKRHENSQHFTVEHWRCDEKKSTHATQTCGKVIYRRELFRQHLSTYHDISDAALLESKLERCRIGRNCEARFWCGFCEKIVEIKRDGVLAWTERFNHVDDHFHGRNGQVKKEISDWRDQPLTYPRPGSPANDSEGLGATSSTSASSADHDISDHTILEKQYIRMAKPKRKRDDRSEALVSKRIATEEVVAIFHCCGETMPVTSKQCTNFPCEHKLCIHCHGPSGESG